MKPNFKYLFCAAYYFWLCFLRKMWSMQFVWGIMEAGLPMEMEEWPQFSVQMV